MADATEALSITVKRHFTAARSHFDTTVYSQSLMCRILYAFQAGNEESHNCLGCNFNDLTAQTAKYLAVASRNQEDFDLHHLFSMYVFLLNTCWERISDVFGIISVPDGYRHRHFSPFFRIRRWANFFKHPKVFGWYVHHPHYTIANSDDHKILLADKQPHRFIDDEFLKKYYSAECDKNAGKLRGEFKGFERSTVVVIPDIVELTRDGCACLDDFVTLITKNPVYMEELHNTSTIVEFYANTDCDEASS